MRIFSFACARGCCSVSVWVSAVLRPSSMSSLLAKFVRALKRVEIRVTIRRGLRVKRIACLGNREWLGLEKNFCICGARANVWVRNGDK